MIKVLDWLFTVIVVLGLPIVTVGVIEGFSFGKTEHAIHYLTFFAPIFLVNLFKLNVIISLLRLKGSQIADASQATRAFQESVNQIYSIALVHEKLYQSDSVSHIDMKDYIEI